MRLIWYHHPMSDITIYMDENFQIVDKAVAKFAKVTRESGERLFVNLQPKVEVDLLATATAEQLAMIEAMQLS